MKENEQERERHFIVGSSNFIFNEIMQIDTFYPLHFLLAHSKTHMHELQHFQSVNNV
jgi:hypothetical protein